MYSGADDEQVKKTLTLSLEKFNKDSGLGKHFALLKFERALVSVSFQLTSKPTLYSTNKADSLFLFFFESENSFVKMCI